MKHTEVDEGGCGMIRSIIEKDEEEEEEEEEEGPRGRSVVGWWVSGKAVA